MIPNLLSEEPPAQTSAKEPWVSDGIWSQPGVLSARLWPQGEKGDLGLLSLPKQLGDFLFQKLLGISRPLRASC